MTNKKAKDIEKNEESWFYSNEVKEHFFNPKNILTEKDEKDFIADGVGMVGSPACGDMMKIWIKVDPKSKRIKKCKWRTYGCASAIAATSMLSLMVTEKGGMKISEAEKIKPQDIIKRLGGLPPVKVHCSILGDQALRAAIEDYKSKIK